MRIKPSTYGRTGLGLGVISAALFVVSAWQDSTRAQNHWAGSGLAVASLAIVFICAAMVSDMSR